MADPEVYLNAVGDDLGATMGNIIDKSYKLMVEIKPDAVLVLGDTNSCLSVIGAKRLHIPIFHMEAGNRCFDECLPEETNRRIVDINRIISGRVPTIINNFSFPLFLNAAIIFLILQVQNKYQDDLDQNFRLPTSQSPNPPYRKDL